ncbi:unnamed protein product [Mycena citricolor]|uniref:Uncharacterized protein n=1 Tax=Mycena citricolor TaxID=2018698 RepID=A0AAD2H134_9AGAR|nr:unnamed protein product [Mycena citricolor]
MSTIHYTTRRAMAPGSWENTCPSWVAGDYTRSTCQWLSPCPTCRCSPASTVRPNKWSTIRAPPPPSAAMRCWAYGTASAGVPPPSGLRSSACRVLSTSPTVTAAPDPACERTSILAFTSPVSTRRNSTSAGGSQAAVSSRAWCGPSSLRNVRDGRDRSSCITLRHALMVGSVAPPLASCSPSSSSSSSGSGIGCEMSGVGGVVSAGL